MDAVNQISTLSPCILVCSIDLETGYCFGCGRTRDEIGGWMSYTNRERAEIVADLDERLKTIKRKPRRETRRTRMKNRRMDSNSDHG